MIQIRGKNAEINIQNKIISIYNIIFIFFVKVYFIVFFYSYTDATMF